MKKFFINTHKYIDQFGFNPIRFFNGMRFFFGFYLKDYFKIKKALRGGGDFQLYLDYPCLHDKFDNSGVASGHYFHQDLLVAQKIFQNNPIKHIDIGSRIDGFVAHIASFREIEVFDIRKLENNAENIFFKQLDLMQEMPKEYVSYTESISCLHTLEHFGLGRYGDSLDISGHIQGFRQISKILKKGGKMYFSVPIGKIQRIEFNAHRVFSLQYLKNQLFNGHYIIISFSYVDDSGDLHKNIPLNKIDFENTFQSNYGCGIFELEKIY